MPTWTPKTDDYAERTRASFHRQPLMATLGAVLEHVGPGAVDIALPFREGVTQQHGYFHAGATSAIADTAAGYAAYTLFDPMNGVLTVEFKINLLAPAVGDKLIARGRVERSGRTITVCRADVVAVANGAEKAVAIGLFTMMQVQGITG